MDSNGKQHVLSAPPRAHIPVTSFGLDTPDASPTQSRPGSPGRQLSGYSTPATEYTNSAVQSRSSSKDPLVKARIARLTSNDSSEQSLWNKLKAFALEATRHDDAVGEHRGRRPSMAQEAGQRPPRPVARKAADGPTKDSHVSKNQLALAFAMIALVGTNDSATGANLSSMQEHYGVSEAEISLTFLAIVVGYAISCSTASLLQHHVGLRYSLQIGLGILAAGCIVLICTPPFVAMIFGLVLVGCGNGYVDANITTVVSHQESSTLMSVIYSAFGLGAFAAPLLIGGFVDAGISWSMYYALPLGSSVILAGLSYFMFAGYVEPEDEHQAGPGLNSTDIPLEIAPGSGATNDMLSTATSAGQVVHARARLDVQTRFKRVLRLPVAYIAYVLIILSFAILDTLSAWAVSYLIEKKGSPAAASRYMLSGLWGGVAIGRIVVSYLLDSRLGERTFAIFCLSVTAAFMGLIWAVHSYIADAIALAVVGFFLGPVTPKTLSMISARVPASLKSVTMSLTIGLGLVGSAAGPLLFGLAAGRGWLSSLPAVLIVASALSAGVWMSVPRNQRRDD